MDDECFLRCYYNCSDKDALSVSQSGGERVQNVIEASKIHGDNIHAELETKLGKDPNHAIKYHKACITKYLTKARRLFSKKQSAASSVVPEKRTRLSLGPPFDWLRQCLYCGESCLLKPDPKNPQRWNPAYLVRETEEKRGSTADKTYTIEKRIKDKCAERADEWAEDVLHRLSGLIVRAADLHAGDARYHKECYTRFFSGRHPPGEPRMKETSTDSVNAVKKLVLELQKQRFQKWDSVSLMERYLELGGKPMRRSALIKLICDKEQDLVVLSAPGYRSVVFFRDNTSATLKMIKDENEDDNLEAALDLVAKHVKKECSELKYHHQTYSTKISKEIADESASYTMQRLLDRLSLAEQSLPSLLIGNIITSAIKKSPTPLQIALGVYFHKKKMVKHMHDYLVCCTYDELLRFKRSSAMGQYAQICRERRQPARVDGLLQVVVDNFDAELSSPNGLVATHDMAIIETRSESAPRLASETIPRISKADMSKPICPEEQDEIIVYHGKAEKPVPPALMPSDLTAEYFEAQRISDERAGDMDFTFLKVICAT